MIFRYVPHDRVPDYIKLGWVFAADLGPVHGEWSCLMQWLCACKIREPVEAA